MKTARRLLAVGAVAAFAVAGAATAAADGWQAQFNAAGWVSYVGGTGEGSSSTSSFEIVEGEITGVTIDANNQMVIGSLTDLSVCHGNSCGSHSNTRFVSVNSYHAELQVTGIEIRSFMRPSPNGDVPDEAEVIRGLLTGTLNAEFESGYGPGGMDGILDLSVTGTGEFACFAPQMGPLSDCMDGPGQLLPVGLDIVATGPFSVDITSQSSSSGHVYYSGDLVVDLNATADLGGIARKDPRHHRKRHDHSRQRGQDLRIGGDAGHPLTNRWETGPGERL